MSSLVVLWILFDKIEFVVLGVRRPGEIVIKEAAVQVQTVKEGCCEAGAVTIDIHQGLSLVGLGEEAPLIEAWPLAALLARMIVTIVDLSLRSHIVVVSVAIEMILLDRFKGFLRLLIHVVVGLLVWPLVNVLLWNLWFLLVTFLIRIRTLIESLLDSHLTIVSILI